MTTVVATNYTQEEFDDILCSLNCCYSSNAYKVAKSGLYGLPCSNDCVLAKLFLYRWALDDWEQNENGTTTGYFNYLTQTELTQIVEAVKQICGNC